MALNKNKQKRNIILLWLVIFAVFQHLHLHHSEELKQNSLYQITERHISVVNHKVGVKPSDANLRTSRKQQISDWYTPRLSLILTFMTNQSHLQIVVLNYYHSEISLIKEFSNPEL